MALVTSAWLPKSTSGRLAVCAFCFTLPILIFYYFRIANFSPSGRFPFDAGRLSGSFGACAGLSLGVWATAFSIAFFNPSRTASFIACGAAHAAVWVALFILFTSAFLRFKFQIHLLVFPRLLPSCLLYLECSVYSTALLLVSSLTTRSTRTQAQAPGPVNFIR
jgi:hypothetical protein